MKNSFSFIRNGGWLTMTLAVIAGVLFVVGGVQAATTISTNISTDGTLSVTGASTLTGLTSMVQGSSTRFSVHNTAYFGGTATSSFSIAGVLTAVGNTSLVTASTTGAVSLGGALWVGGFATTTAAGAFGTESTITATSATTTLASSTVRHLSIGSTTPSQIANAEAVIEGKATTTLYISTSAASPTGGCIQMKGPAGVNYRIYVGGAANALIVEAGLCK